MTYKDKVYANVTLAQAEKFWTQVQICAHGETCADCCWEWQGMIRRGYGQFRARHQGVETAWRTHRFMWVVVYGEIPDGLWVLHRCDNPPCCNPAHLWVGTQSDNQLDSVRKGRQRLGEQHPHARLTTTQVRHLRQLRAAGWSLRALIRVYGVSYQAIRDIVHRRTWKHVDPVGSEESHD